MILCVKRYLQNRALRVIRKHLITQEFTVKDGSILENFVVRTTNSFKIIFSCDTIPLNNGVTYWSSFIKKNSMKGKLSIFTASAVFKYFLLHFGFLSMI